MSRRRAPSPPPAEAPVRLTELVRLWKVQLRRVVETRTSVIAYGERYGRRVVLKVIRAPGEEWNAGAVAAAFHGRGLVRVHEHVPGAALLEELRPGISLAEIVRAGRDEEATRILARLIGEMMEVSPPTAGHDAVEDWGMSFDRYLVGGDDRIPSELVRDARHRYTELCRTQGEVRLLHGDLQHYNVLSDRTRGWAAIDPKGVVGEIEYELGASLRNPHAAPELYSTTDAVERRIDRLASDLGVDRDRVAAWAYAQAVLSAVWTIEDDGVLDGSDPALRLATAIRPLLG